MKQYMVIDWYKRRVVNANKAIYSEQEAKALAFDTLVENAKAPDVVPEVRIEVKELEW